MDDWITGQWRRAAVQVTGRGRNWTYTFEPLDAEDVPEAAAFPVRFRRTLKVRLFAAGQLPPIEGVRVLTDSEWREVEVCLRLRHPRQESLRRVEIDGEEWCCFDAASETISLPLRPETLRLRALYR